MKPAYEEYKGEIIVDDANNSQVARDIKKSAKPESKPAYEEYKGEVIPMEKSAPPVPSFGQNVISGLKVGANNLVTGAKQRLDEGANYLESALGGQSINKLLGMENAADILPKTNQQIIANRAIDVPVMETAGGKVGNFISTAVPAIGAGLIPGGQGLSGSLLAGGLFGMAQPTVPGESVAMNTGVGTLSGGLGYGAARGLGALGTAISDSRLAKQTANAAKDATASMAKDLGYVIPPTQTNASGVRGFVNKTLEGAAGKISTGQKASLINQPITNQAIAKELGLPMDQPISIEALKKVRSVAGQAYDEVKQLGTIITDKKFAVDLDDIVSATRNAEKDFPGLGDTKLEDIVKSLKQPQFKADNAIAAIKLIRNKSDAAFAQNDKTLGGAYRKATGVLEDMIERAAEKSDNPELLANFKKARTDIAKTYSVEKALNDATGNVASRKLAAQLSRGKPLSGDIKKVAQFAQAFPKAADEIQTSIPGTSPLDWAMGGGISAGLGNPAGLATVLARPSARSIILSRPYQGLMGTPRYESMLAKALQNRITQEGIRAGTLAGLPQLIQK